MNTNPPFDDKEKAEERRYVREQEKKYINEMKAIMKFENFLSALKLSKTDEIKAKFDEVMKTNQSKKEIILDLLSKPDKEEEVIEQLMK